MQTKSAVRKHTNYYQNQQRCIKHTSSGYITTSLLIIVAYIHFTHIVYLPPFPPLHFLRRTFTAKRNQCLVRHKFSQTLQIYSEHNSLHSLSPKNVTVYLDSTLFTARSGYMHITYSTLINIVFMQNGVMDTILSHRITHSLTTLGDEGHIGPKKLSYFGGVFHCICECQWRRYDKNTSTIFISQQYSRDYYLGWFGFWYILVYTRICVQTELKKLNVFGWKRLVVS